MLKRSSQLIHNTLKRLDVSLFFLPDQLIRCSCQPVGADRHIYRDHHSVLRGIQHLRALWLHV